MLSEFSFPISKNRFYSNVLWRLSKSIWICPLNVYFQKYNVISQLHTHTYLTDQELHKGQAILHFYLIFFTENDFQSSVFIFIFQWQRCYGLKKWPMWTIYGRIIHKYKNNRITGNVSKIEALRLHIKTFLFFFFWILMKFLIHIFYITKAKLFLNLFHLLLWELSFAIDPRELELRSRYSTSKHLLLKNKVSDFFCLLISLNG